jgi:hypothetical protein
MKSANHQGPHYVMFSRSLCYLPCCLSTLFLYASVLKPSLRIGTSKIILHAYENVTGRKKWLVGAHLCIRWLPNYWQDGWFVKSWQICQLISQTKQAFSCGFFFALPNYCVYKHTKAWTYLQYCQSLDRNPLDILKAIWNFFVVLQQFLCTYSITSHGKPLCVRYLIWYIC